MGRPPSFPGASRDARARETIHRAGRLPTQPARASCGGLQAEPIESAAYLGTSEYEGSSAAARG